MRAEIKCRALSILFVHVTECLTGEPALAAFARRVRQAVARFDGIVGSDAAYEAATACTTFRGERFVTRSAPPAHHWRDAATEHAAATAAPKRQQRGPSEQHGSKAVRGIDGRASGVDTSTAVDVRGWQFKQRSNGRACGSGAATAPRECLELGATEDTRPEDSELFGGRGRRCADVSSGR